VPSLARVEVRAAALHEPHLVRVRVRVRVRVGVGVRVGARVRVRVRVRPRLTRLTPTLTLSSTARDAPKRVRVGVGEPHPKGQYPHDEARATVGIATVRTPLVPADECLRLDVPMYLIRGVR
jgi:hypothetical protein